MGTGKRTKIIAEYKQSGAKYFTVSYSIPKQLYDDYIKVIN